MIKKAMILVMIGCIAAGMLCSCVKPPAMGGTDEDIVGDSDLDKIEVVESAFYADPDTGEYRTVVVIRNNSDEAFGEITLLPEAYDKDGNLIEAKDPDEVTEDPFVLESQICYPGGTEVVFDKSSISEDSDRTVYSFYDTCPERLEWRINYGIPQPVDGSHGLSISGWEVIKSEDAEDPQDLIALTVKNDSSRDYKWNAGDGFYYYSDDGKCSLDIDAVYRDADGNIVDADMLYVSDEESNADIPAGGENTIVCCLVDEYMADAVPEFYINVIPETED